MSYMNLAVLLTVVPPLLYIVVDIALAVNRHEGDTYSEIIRAAARKWQPLVMIICFGFGLLAGHWFW
jgi:hypothetical protein